MAAADAGRSGASVQRTRMLAEPAVGRAGPATARQDVLTASERRAAKTSQPTAGRDLRPEIGRPHQAAELPNCQVLSRAFAAGFDG